MPGDLHQLPAVAGLAGAALCLAGHVPGRLRDWGPHAVALAAMWLMVLGTPDGGLLWAGAVAVALACGWRACAGCAARRSADVVDLASMAVLTAATAAWAVPSHGAHTGMAMTGASSADGPWLGLFLFACWAITRTGMVAAAQVRARPGAPAGTGSGARPGAGRRVVLLREAGGIVMIAGMAAMFR